MSVLAEYPKVRGLDVCEVLPAHDSTDGRTSRLAALGILAWMNPRIVDATPKVTPEQIRKVFLR
jgi:arginase family enzyme